MRGGEGFETLRRIALLLLVLAILAERASPRSHAVRCRVLCALRPAQAAASAFAEDIVHLAPETGLHAHETALRDPDEQRALDFGDSPEAAVRLAAEFRVLAFIFFALARLAPRREQWSWPNQRRSGASLRQDAVRRADLCLACRSRAPPASRGLTFPARRSRMRFLEAA